MTDIEVKRKELETAKRIRDNNGNCGALVPEPSCFRDFCPANNPSKGLCKNFDWDAFIATREAELAELDKKESTNADCAPTVDDFALALIQGGYFQIVLGEDAAIGNLIARATKIRDALKAESDRRRS